MSTRIYLLNKKASTKTRRTGKCGRIRENLAKNKMGRVPPRVF